MDYCLSISDYYRSPSEVKLDDDGQAYKRTIPLGTYNGKYRSGTYEVFRSNGWFTDDYYIRVGLGEKLAKFLSDIGYLRKFGVSSTFGDYLEKFPTVKKATSPFDTGFGPCPIFYTPNNHVNVYSEYIELKIDLDKEFRGKHEIIDKYAIEALRIMERIIDEVVQMTPLDFSRFSFRPSQRGSSFHMPQWAGGITKIGLKAFANYLGASLPDFDLSGGGDSSFDFSIGDSDFDFTDSDFNFDSDFDSITFGHAPNDGSYTDSGKDVNIQVAGGNNKGSYDVYYHHGDKYIDFQNQWVKIQGKTRFHLNGNDYVIKWS